MLQGIRTLIYGPYNAAHNLRVRPPRKRRAGAPLADRVKQGEPREAPKQAA